MIASEWGIALQTLRVKKLRSLLSVTAIALAVGLLIAMMLLMGYVNQSLEQQMYAKFGGADLNIEFRPDREGWTSTIGAQMIGQLDPFGYIQSMEPVLNLSLRYADQKDTFTSTGISYYGVSNGPFVQARFQFKQALQAGEVILTFGLARRLGVGEGDLVFFPLESGREVEWRVAGIIDDLPAADGTWEEQALFHLESVQQVTGLEGRVNQLIAMTKPGANSSAIYASLRAEGTMTEHLIVTPMEGLESERFNIRNLRIIGYAFAIIAFMISAVLLLGMMETSFREKLKDLAIIRSLGGGPDQIRRIALYESIFIIVAGVVAGIGIGIVMGRKGTMWLARWLQIEAADIPINVWLIAIIAIIAALSLVALSLIPANKVSQVDPMDSYRQAADSEAESDHLILLVLVGAAGGLVLILMSLIYPAIFIVRGLLNIVGGLILVAAAVGLMFVSLRWLLRLIASFFALFGGRISLIAVEQLAADRKQTAYVISVIGLTLAVFVTISTYMSTALTENMQYINKRYAADIVVKSSLQFSNSSALSMDLYNKIQEIPSVRAAIPIAPGVRTQLVDYDFSRSDQHWVSTHEDMIGKLGPLREQMNVVFTDFGKLMEHNLLALHNMPPNTAIIPREYARNLGVDIGDVLKLKHEDSYKEIVIGAVVDQFLNYHPGSNIFFDLHESELWPAIDGKLESILIIPDSDDYSGIHDGLVILQRTYPELRWGDRRGELEQFTQQMNQRIGMLWAVVGFTFIGGMMGMFNALSASIHARRREYAILRALHLTPGQMMLLVFFQSLISAILSILLGLVSGFTLFMAIYNGMEGFEQSIAISVAWKQIMIIAGLITGLSVLVSLPMAVKLMRMRITRALTLD